MKRAVKAKVLFSSEPRTVMVSRCARLYKALHDGIQGPGSSILFVALQIQPPGKYINRNYSRENSHVLLSLRSCRCDLILSRYKEICLFQL
jgi:hypothetical protein